MARETYVIRDGKLIPKHLARPLNQPKGNGLQVIKDIEPFQNIAIDGGVIGSRRQKRDMMRAHGLTEVGNENQGKNGNPVREFTDNHRERVDDIKQAFRQHGVDIL